MLDPAVAISSVAEAALKTPLVLKSYGSVRVVIDAPIEAAIARGEVRRVGITGTAWSSPRSLACRNIEFIVDEPCALDVEAAVGMRGILLKRPARGSARLTFDSSDFGNFLSHPLLRGGGGERDEGGFDFVFEGGETARVCGDEGYLEYSGVVGGSGERRTIRMRPMEGSRVDAHLVGADADETFERSMASFFERLVIDLEGTELRYRDMTIDPALDRRFRARSVREKVSVAEYSILRCSSTVRLHLQLFSGASIHASRLTAPISLGGHNTAATRPRITPTGTSPTSPPPSSSRPRHASDARSSHRPLANPSLSSFATR